MGRKFDPPISYVPYRDVIGLISRKIIKKGISPLPEDQIVDQAYNDSLLSSFAINDLGMHDAFTSYDGTKDLDLWLNLQTTTWTKANHVKKVLDGRYERACVYLQYIGLKQDIATCGFLSGKITSMTAICLLREIFHSYKNDLYPSGTELYQDVKLINHFIQLSRNNHALSETLKKIIDASDTMEEMEIALIAHYLPVNNAVIASRIFKGRVKNTMFHDFYQLLKHPGRSETYMVHFFLGFMSRLCYLNINDPYWTKATCYDPLKKIVTLYRKVIHIDFDFVTDTFPIFLSRFTTRHKFNIDFLYALFTYRIIYKAAITHKTQTETGEILLHWQNELGILIKIIPDRFFRIYDEMPFHNLFWANQQLVNAVLVSKK